MRSIRTSLVVGTVAATVVVFSVASVAIYRGAKATLVSHIDEELGEEVRLVASSVRSLGEAIDLEFQELDMPEFTSTAGPGYMQLSLRDGTLLYRSPGLHGADLKLAAPMDSNHTVFEWARTPGGRRARVAGLRFAPQPSNEGAGDPDAVPLPSTRTGPLVVDLVAALEPTEEVAFLARLKILLVTVGALTALAATGILAVVIRTSLHPLDELAGKIATLSDTGLSSRVQLSATPREVEPIVGQLNQLLSRLEDAFVRERTFSADIAHELRTPLAGLRSAVEVALSRPRPADDYRETLDGTLAIIRRVQTMVETLLYLGRLESGQIEIEERSADVGELVETSWTPLEATARARRLDVAFSLPRGVNVVTDPILLEIAIRNVLENATLYADEGGYVKVEVAEENGAGTLRVVNSGSKVAPEDVGTLLRRFTRGDVSRKTSGDHFGLGLALAAKIATALRCSMQVESRAGGEFEVTFAMKSDRDAS